MKDIAGAIERKATIFNIQKYNVYDGPGIRTMIFFKGCPLRCKWCANPEGLRREVQVLYSRENCIDCGRCIDVCPVGIHGFSREEMRHTVDRSIRCIGCRKCLEVCPNRALQIMGEEKSISELMQTIEEDNMFYHSSGGGVTLGGGEVTAQSAAATSLLQACRQRGLSTAVETCGYAKPEDILHMAQFTDLFLFDLKHIDPTEHSRWTGVHNERILDNLQALLQGGYHVKVRMPLIKGVNDAAHYIDETAKFLLPYKDYKNFHGIDLLPYHKMGVSKYQQLDMPYEMQGEFSISDPDLSRIEQQLRGYGYEVRVIRH